MARKIVVAEIPQDALACFNRSSLRREFQCLAYSEQVCYEKGSWYLFGKKNILVFIDRIESQLVEFLKLVPGPETEAEVAADRKFLKTLKALKAS